MKVRDIIIRIGYTLLGSLLTLCIMLIHEEYFQDQTEEMAVVEAAEEDNLSQTGAVTVQTAAVPYQAPEVELADYEKEAEEKLMQLQAEIEQKKLEKTEEESAVEEEIENLAVETVSANSIEAAPVKWIQDYPAINSDKLLAEKMNERSSYEETLAVNAFDKKVIENSTIDFSDVKITIMGDSLTSASNLTDEDKEKYSYPAQLQQILGCKEIVNMGIGGSSICEIGDYPMVERWNDIPKDSDIIIVFGGTNDTLFENKWEYGNLEYEKRMKSGTFCGDLDKLTACIENSYVKDNEENYCKLLFVNPPANIVSDAWYQVNPVNILPQSAFAEAINVIAPTYGFEVIDMFNNNILNTHDENVKKEFMPDGIHGNAEGYRIMAEHIASQIIQRIEQ